MGLAARAAANRSVSRFSFYSRVFWRPFWSPLQVSLNYLMSKGLVPEIETRLGSLAWECGGSMLWRLDENAIGILDERCEAVEKGETGDGGGPALA